MLSSSFAHVGAAVAAWEAAARQSILLQPHGLSAQFQAFEAWQRQEFSTETQGIRALTHMYLSGELLGDSLSAHCCVLS